MKVFILTCNQKNVNSNHFIPMKLATICKFDVTSSFGKGVEQWESSSLLWKCKLMKTLGKV